MQNQINKFLIVLMAAVLLGVASCTSSPNNTQQNNTVSNNNQITPSETVAPMLTCDQSGLTNEITNHGKIPNIRQNFISGKAVLALSGKELTIKGAITSPGDEFNDFIKLLDSFRKQGCVTKIIFAGGTYSGNPPNFEWTNSADPENSCSTVNIDDAVEKSGLKSQAQKFIAAMKGRELTLTGTVVDSDGENNVKNDHIKKLFGSHLQSALKSGCISKIIFGSQTKIDTKPLVEQQFSWMICDPGIECNGQCEPGPTCKKTSSNTLTNTVTNANTNR